MTGSAQPSGQAVVATANKPLPQLNQDVVVGKVRWRATFAATVGNVLHSDNQYISDLKTPGLFLKATYQVENLSNTAKTFDMPTVVDARGREFKATYNADHWIPEAENCFLPQLNPNVAKTCTAYYEIPSDGTLGVRAKVSSLDGLFGGDTAYIDLTKH